MINFAGGALSREVDMEMGGALRWLFNCSAWNPSAPEFSSCLSLLPPPEQHDVIRNINLSLPSDSQDSELELWVLAGGGGFDQVDQAFALEAELVLGAVVGIFFRDFHPLENCFKNPSYPNLNFNVSHHGDYVALASEPVCLVGLDIMVADAKEQKASDEYIKNFRSCFTRLEWKNITSVGPDPGRLLHQFSRYWCMKESYIKAVGIGLGFKLQRVEFFFEDGNVWGDVAYLRLDGVDRADWCFHLSRLDDNHWACVAKGPPADATESFKETLHVVDLDESAMAINFKKHTNPFTQVTIKDIIPCSDFPGTTHEQPISFFP